MRCLTLLATLLLLAGCSDTPSTLHRQFFAFGTLVELTLVDTESGVSATAADRIEQDFNRYHALWHPWHPGPLQDVNRALARGEPVAPDATIKTLLDLATPLARNSGYRFDPGVGKLVKLWGFQSDEGITGPPPPAAAIAVWRTSPASLADIRWHNGQLASSNRSLQLDFGAFAKGYAIDLAIAELKHLGIHNAIINAGGDLRAIGTHPDRPWRIGIRHPRTASVLASIEIQGDESIFTSGDYERFFEYEGNRYHHILDPGSGLPATGATSVTVIHTDAATADAAATALFVAGPEQWWQVARDMGIQYVLLIDGAGVAHMNPAMARRIHFESSPEPQIILSEPLT